MFPIMTTALRQIDPFTFTCMRYAIAGLAFLAVLLYLEGRGTLSLKGERVGLAWFFGTAGFADFQFLVFLGQQLAGRDGALTASIMMATMRLLGFIVNWVVRKVRPPIGSLACIVLSFAGVTPVITHGHYGHLLHSPGAFAADGLIILGALCVGAAFFPTWSPYKYTTITTGLGLSSAVAITAGLLAFGAIQSPSAGDVVAITPQLTYMAIAAGFVGVLCWNLGNKILTPLNGVLFMDVVPIAAFTISAIQGIRPAPIQIAGASITAITLILNNIYLRHRLVAAPGVRAPAPARGVLVTATADAA